MRKAEGLFYLLRIFRRLEILRHKKTQFSMAKTGRIIREAAVWLKAEKADSPVKVHSRTYGKKAKYSGKLRRD
jgi:hypothetical protein